MILRPGEPMLEKVRQLLESAVWHGFQTGQAVSRSLTAYDH